MPTPASSEGSSTLQATRTTITSAQLLALFTTPITLGAAPGSGKLLYPLALVARAHGGTVPYALVGQILLKWGATAYIDNAGLDVRAVLVSAGLDETCFVGIPNSTFDSDWEDTALLDNQPVTITTSGNNPTAGDGVLTATLFYMVATLS